MAQAVTTADKNGVRSTRVTADLLLGPNIPCVVELPTGQRFYAGLTGASGEIGVSLAAFTGPFAIKTMRKGDDEVYAEGVA